MPLPLSGLLLAIAIALSAPGSTQIHRQPQTPIPVPTGTSGFGERTIPDSPYLDLVERYRNAVADGADDAHMKVIEALAALPDGHSTDRAFKEYQSLAIRTAGADEPGKLSGSRLTMLANAWEAVLPCAAVMHLETAYFLFQEDKDDRAVGHLSIARSIVDWRPWQLVLRIRPEIGTRHASLRRDIYIGITWTLQSYRRLDTLLPHLHRAREHFPDDVMVRLAFGSLEELRATAVEISAVKPNSDRLQIPLATWRRITQKAHWDKAVEYYRAVLDADPSLVEARVRLGRVLRLLGRLKEARRELEAAAAAARASAPVPMPKFGPPMVMPYLSEMFLAEVLEEDGGAAEAMTRYQNIARIWPDCQSGLLAVSRAYEARGDREAAVNALQLLAREQGKRSCIDPWWAYDLGQGWRFGPFIRSLRIQARGPS